MSSIDAGLPSGVTRDQAASKSGSSARVRGVTVAPGAMALMVMPKGDSSGTSPRAIISIAALVMP